MNRHHESSRENSSHRIPTLGSTLPFREKKASSLKRPKEKSGVGCKPAELTVGLENAAEDCQGRMQTASLGVLFERERKDNVGKSGR